MDVLVHSEYGVPINILIIRALELGLVNIVILCVLIHVSHVPFDLRYHTNMTFLETHADLASFVFKNSRTRNCQEIIVKQHGIVLKISKVPS